MRPKGRGLAAVVVLGLAFLSGCQNLRRNEPPVASFELSADEVYVGETVIFDASSSLDPDGTILDFAWDFGDGNKGNGIIVTHAYAEPGTYTVTLTVTDAQGAAGTSQALVNVLPMPEGGSLPVARFTFFPPTPRVGEEVMFDASASTDDGKIVTYFWDFGDGDIGEGVQVIHVYVEAGTYSVVLEVEDDSGLIGRAVAQITVQPGEAEEDVLGREPRYHWPSQ